MARITFSISDQLASVASLRVAQDKHPSLSSYIAGLVEADANKAGLTVQNLGSEILTAAEDIGHEQALKLLTEARRTKRKHRRAA